MKAFILAILFGSLMLSTQGGTESPNREIPSPKQSIAEAVKLVQEWDIKHGGDPGRVVYSAVYNRPDYLKGCLGSNFVQADQSEWSWFITLTHPKKGNSETVYRLRGNGEIYPLIHVQ